MSRLLLPAHILLHTFVFPSARAAGPYRVVEVYHGVKPQGEKD